MLKTLWEKSLRSAMISLGGIVIGGLTAFQLGIDASSLWHPILYGLAATGVNLIREAYKRMGVSEEELEPGDE